MAIGRHQGHYDHHGNFVAFIARQQTLPENSLAKYSIDVFFFCKNIKNVRRLNRSLTVL